MTSKENELPPQYQPRYHQAQIETQIETYLLGKVLTIVDASYPNTEQREAVKSLIKEKFHSQLDWLLDRRKERGSTEDDRITK